MNKENQKELARALEAASKLLTSCAATSEDDSDRNERACANFRESFPALAPRNIKHANQRKVLHSIIPFPIKETWTHEFCCIPRVSQNMTPSAQQADLLIQAGLGKTKIIFPKKNARHDEVCEILLEKFPRLKLCGGFTLHRAKVGGQLQNDLNMAKSNIQSSTITGPTTSCVKCKEKIQISRFAQHKLDCVEVINDDDDDLPLTADKIWENEIWHDNGKKNGMFDVDDLINNYSGTSGMIGDSNQRQELKTQQNQQFAYSLLADQEKDRQKNEMKITESQLLEKAQRAQATCESKLGVEPPLGPDVIPIKIRLPGGDIKVRNFFKTGDVEVLLDFVGSQSESTPAFRVLGRSCIIQSGTKPKSLDVIGITEPCTLNVAWDGFETKDEDIESVVEEEDVDNAITEILGGTVKVIKVGRVLMLTDMVNAFNDESILKSRLSFELVDHAGKSENADDFGGVMRDVLSAFWCEFFKGHAVGDIEMTPCIRHDFTSDNWKAVARIIVKGFEQIGYFPLTINKAFIASALFGEDAIAEDFLLQSFLKYVTYDERTVFEEALKKESIDIEEDSDVIDYLSDHASKRIVRSGAELKTLLVEIAHKELIQTPSYVREAMETVLIYSNMFQNIQELEKLYSVLMPTGKKIISILNPEDIKTDAQRESFNYLKKFVKTLRQEEIPIFLRFVTGADVMCVKSIEVMFTSLSGTERRLIAHTCGPTIELPTSYECFADFKGEVLTMLRSGYWNMDIA